MAEHHGTAEWQGFFGSNNGNPFLLFLRTNAGPAYFKLVTSARYRTRHPFSRCPPKAPFPRLESVMWMCGSPAAMIPPAFRISKGPLTVLYAFFAFAAVEVT